MSFLDKVMFWKKEPTLDLDTSVDLSSPSSFDSGFGGSTMPGTTLQEPGFGAPQAQDPILDSGFGSQQPYNRPQMGTPQDQIRVISEGRPGMGQQELKSDSYDKNLEIVSMKLDNIKVALENINQRLVNIERLAIDSSRQEKKRPNW